MIDRLSRDDAAAGGALDVRTRGGARWRRVISSNAEDCGVVRLNAGALTLRDAVANLIAATIASAPPIGHKPTPPAIQTPRIDAVRKAWSPATAMPMRADELAVV